jgi:hypothetical protein
VFYDGLAVLANLDGASLVQPLRASISPRPTLGHVDDDRRERSAEHHRSDRFSNAATGPAGFTPAIADPFRGTSIASDRAWRNRSSPELAVARLPSSDAPIRTTVSARRSLPRSDHTSTTPYDCVSLGAIVMSTAIKDVDGDGAPDGVEDGIATAGAASTPVTKDADGTALPNLSAMNGSSHHKDIYFQMDAMRTTAPTTTYGNANAPFPGTAPEIVNGVVTLGHIATMPSSGRREDHYRYVP